MFKAGDWVTIMIQDWDEVPVGSVGVIEEIDFTNDLVKYCNVLIKTDTYPYYEEELRLATELEKALA